MNNDVVRCRKLIERGEEMNEALHYAVGRGRLEIVNMLIEAGADLHTEIRCVHRSSSSAFIQFRSGLLGTTH